MIRASQAVLATLLAAPGLASAAYYFEATTTTEGDGMGRRGQTSTVTAWIDGASAKVVFNDDSGGEMFRAGSYLITADAGATVQLVNPAERTVAAIDLAQIFQTVNSVMQATGGLVELQFSDYTNERLLEEPGEPILGYATTHYRFKSGYTMGMRVFGFNRETRVESDQDLYCTDAIDAGGFAVWLRPERLRTGNEAMDEMIASQFADVDCVPLRTRSVATTEGERGRASTVTTTTEVTVLREAAVPGGTFVVPADYERISLIPDLSELPDFSELEAPPAPAASAAAENEKPLSRLRGLFGR